MNTEWRVTNSHYNVRSEDDEVVACVQGQTDKDRKANAQLIAVAPRMAKFLENLCAEFEDFGKVDDSFYCTAKDILAKVEEE